MKRKTEIRKAMEFLTRIGISSLIHFPLTAVEEIEGRRKDIYIDKLREVLEEGVKHILVRYCDLPSNGSKCDVGWGSVDKDGCKICHDEPVGKNCHNYVTKLDIDDIIDRLKKKLQEDADEL